MSYPILECERETTGLHFLEPFTEWLSMRAYVRINENDSNDPRQARNYFYDAADQIPAVLPCANPHCFEGQLDLKTRILEAISQQEEYIQDSFVCQSKKNQAQPESNEACRYFCDFEIWLSYSNDLKPATDFLTSTL